MELEYLDKFKRRSTLRAFSQTREVSDETLAAIIEAASHAPTTGNMQLYSVIVTRDPAAKARLAECHFNQPASRSCNVMLTFCADFRRFERWCDCRDARPGYDNFHSFVTALIDTALFAQQFVTIAELNGIGSCYLGTATYNSCDIARLLETPKRVVPVITLAVGYPEEGFPAPSDRLPVEAIMHSEKYHDPDNADIDRFYAEKEALPESAKFIRENGLETLAQVFTDVRYPKDLNEKISASFAEFIKENGY